MSDLRGNHHPRSRSSIANFALRVVLILAGSLVGIAGIWIGGHLIKLSCTGQFPILSNIAHNYTRWTLMFAPGILIAIVSLCITWYAYHQQSRIYSSGDEKKGSLKQRSKAIDPINLITSLLFIFGILLAVIYILVSSK
jgi:hypothetical protein